MKKKLLLILSVTMLFFMSNCTAITAEEFTQTVYALDLLGTRKLTPEERHYLRNEWQKNRTQEMVQEQVEFEKQLKQEQLIERLEQREKNNRELRQWVKILRWIFNLD